LAGEVVSPTVVGITSTIPVEIVFAAGLKPVDLNNIFINSDMPERLIVQAESAGFSHNICAWIKGIYSIIMNHNIKTVIAVTGGDCSNTVALTELLAHKGVQVITFDYPHNREKDLLMAQMEKFGRSLSVNPSNIRTVKVKLDRIRDKLRKLDRLTFQNNVVTGLENHHFLVSSSDFKSDPALYERELDEFLHKASKREPKKNEIRLGYLGVPPIFGQFYEYIESHGARVVFNEIQRQFSMPYENEDIIEQYLNYTYPYDVNRRIEDIRSAIKERDLDGLIHYTQTFCFRQIYDIIMRETLPLPILTLEGDRPGNIDSRTAIRIETFIEMLKDKQTNSV